MKKLFLMLILAFVSVYSFSLGIGVHLDLEPGISACSSETYFPCGIACSIKTDNYPVALGICTDCDVTNGSLEAYVTADYWIFQHAVSNRGIFYTGAGVVAGTGLIRKSIDFYAGPRAVIGLSWILYDGFLETFVQTGCQAEFRTGWSDDIAVKFPVNTGIRFYY